MKLPFKVPIERHKNNKLAYYTRNVLELAVPRFVFRRQLRRELAMASRFDAGYVAGRVDYYNKLEGPKPLSGDTPRIRDLELQKKHNVYVLDTLQVARYFDGDLRLAHVFGDVAHVPPVPSVVKSRPVDGDNANSVLLKLNKVRHFTFVNDRRPFASKKDMLVFRAAVNQPQRARFLELYRGHPLCDVGQTNRRGGNPAWQAERMTIDQQLDYKFILCIEGHDVASSLKWVMSSSSVAVMPRPKFETWFMEGKLLPGVHYVCIREDYSDLEEKLHHYMAHPGEAVEIARNANLHVAQFKDRRREKLISLLVLDKYFEKTGQKHWGG